MSFFKKNARNIIFLSLILLLIIPQTRQSIQIMLHKAVALVKPVHIIKEQPLSLPHYNWELVSVNNKVFNFEEAKGKIILINFWATWCPPCVAELPSMQALYNDYHEKIIFLFVTNENFSEVAEFLNTNHYTFKSHHPVTEYPEYFNITTIPRTFLIDKNANIVIDESGAANWNSKKVRQTIDALLK